MYDKLQVREWLTTAVTMIPLGKNTGEVENKDQVPWRTFRTIPDAQLAPGCQVRVLNGDLLLMLVDCCEH